MAYWFHRNPYKATAPNNFDVKLIVLDKEALDLFSLIRKKRAHLLDLFPDAGTNQDVLESGLHEYLELLRGFVEKPDGSPVGLSGLVRFKWAQSLQTQAETQVIGDVTYELFSILHNYAVWLMKHAALLAAKEDISLDTAKAVHQSLKKAAGVFTYLQGLKIPHLATSDPAADHDPVVISANLNQCTAEAQEVTIARAMELKHKPAIISTLAFETYKMFDKAATGLKARPSKDTEKWAKYLELKSYIYLAYAFSFAGENLLSQDKCGEAIRALRESLTYHNQAKELSKLYCATKGTGSSARPTDHLFFRNLSRTITVSLEKCERENGFIYHQKIPQDPPPLEGKASYGLANPEPYVPPPVSPLWTPIIHSAIAPPPMDLSKDPQAQSKAALRAEGALPSVVEVPTKQTTQDPSTKSGCNLQ